MFKRKVYNLFLLIINWGNNMTGAKNGSLKTIKASFLH